MKTRIIYQGAEIDVPSFHATRLIKNGVATLPKISTQTNRGRREDGPKETVLQEDGKGSPDEATAATSESAADTQAGRQYRRRDMKAQD